MCTASGKAKAAERQEIKDVLDGSTVSTNGALLASAWQ